MESMEYPIAYREVLEILNYIPKFYYDKIPDEKIQLYKTMQDRNYNFKYNPLKTLDEQNVSKRARAIIGLLFRDYWATETQRQKVLAKQTYERQKIEEEKKKRYDYNDLFKTTNLSEVNYNTNTDTALVKYNEKFFIKILNKIKKFFKMK